MTRQGGDNYETITMDYFEELFNNMKTLGFFAKYENYQEWRKEKFGDGKTNIDEFKKSLSKEDKKRFKAMFDD